LLQLRLDRLQAAVGQKAVVQQLAPLSVGQRLTFRLVQRPAHQGLGIGFLAEDQGHQFQRRLAAQQRLDERLAHADRAVVRPAVAPRLERMRLRQQPLALERSLVAVSAQVDGGADLGQGLLEFEIGRRVVHWIPAQHQQRFDFPALHPLDQIRQLAARRSVRSRRFLGVRHRLAGVAQQCVQVVDAGVYLGWLARPRGDHRGPAMLEQIGGHGLQDTFTPSAADCRAFDLAGVQHGAHPPLQVGDDGCDIRGPHGQAMIGRCAGH